MNVLRRLATVALFLLTAGCASVQAPGMIASSSDEAMEPGSTEGGASRTVLVAFPASACTSSESAVFIDDTGHFVGSVAPGTAADLPVPVQAKHVFVVGSLDVFAPPRSGVVRHEVPIRSDQGIIISVTGADAHNCRGKWSGPLSPRPEAASLAARAQAARGLRRLAVLPGEGDRWLGEHRERVDEIVGRARDDSSTLEPVVMQARQAN